jgi:translation initiation factor 5A
LIDITAEGEKAPVSLLTEAGETKDDLNLPDDAELAADIRAAFDDGKAVIVSVLAAMGTEQIISWKEDTKA